MTHNKDYWKEILNVDLETPPFVSGIIVMSMDHAVMDI
jgi:hypothetical protein